MLRIGLLDSGVGGFSVLRELAKHYPQFEYFYFGDTARFPYGTKGKTTITRYAEEACHFLCSHSVDCIVIACNTISAYALDALKKIFKIPIFGVIEPTIQTAYTSSKTKRIGIIATRATVDSQMYENLLQQIDPNVTVVAQACPLFVSIVEENFSNSEIIQQIVSFDLEPILKSTVDTLILGCTHYPLLVSYIEKALPLDTRIIDPAESCVKAVSSYIDAAERNIKNRDIGTIHLFASDHIQRFNEIAKRFFDISALLKHIEFAKEEICLTGALKEIGYTL